MRKNTRKTLLLIIDLQKEFSGNQIYHDCIDFVQTHSKDYSVVLATHFKNQNNLNFPQALHWDGCDNTSLESLEFTIHPTCGQLIYYLKKNTYAIQLPESFKEYDITIIGCDTDACVMATLFWLWDNGFTNVHLLSDYTYTTAKEYSKDDVLKMLKRNFGNWIVSNKENVNI